ncbi:MAG TPA: nitrate/nitrite transporter NrtS [Gemmatimonadales bacterium]
MVRDALRLWWRLVCDRTVVLRGLKYAVVVGAILVMINHGDAILRGDLGAGRLVRIGLTVLVPYCVSALSSVGAIRQLQAALPPSPAPPAPSSAPRSRSS